MPRSDFKSKLSKIDWYWYEYDDDGWDTGVEIVRGCPVARRRGAPIVLVRWSVLAAAARLEELLGDVEFLLYAKARKNGKYIVVDEPVVPKQRVSYASVTVEEPIHGTNAVLHRHPSGLASFSDVDDEHINANNDVSILWVDGWVAKVAVKVRLPCGAYELVDARWAPLVVGSIEDEEAAGARAAEEGIKRITVQRWYWWPKERSGR